MAIGYLNRVKANTSTVGTGAVTVGTAITDAVNGDFQTFAAAGAVDGTTYPYLLIDGHNWEFGYSPYSSSLNQLTTRTVTQSILGTTPITLSGAAVVSSPLLASDIVGTMTGPLTPIVVNTASSAAVIVPAQAGLIIRVYKIFITAGSAGSFPNTVSFEDSTPTLLSGPIYFANDGASVILDNPSGSTGSPWFTCAVGKAFQLVNNGLIQISGTVYYTATAT